MFPSTMQEFRPFSTYSASLSPDNPTAFSTEKKVNSLQEHFGYLFPVLGAMGPGNLYFQTLAAPDHFSVPNPS